MGTFGVEENVGKTNFEEKINKNERNPLRGEFSMITLSPLTHHFFSPFLKC